VELGALKGKGRWIVLAAALLMAGVLLWPRAVDRPAAGRAVSYKDRPRVERIIPDSVRIRVEVLNATNVRGLARQATFHLRDLGFDVVGSGNSADKFDSTVVIVRSGRMDWGELAAKALGGARIEARPDSSRYLDLTILLGAAWRPPPETLHP
jgi:LytR cell envelope-related transcriptional attenuator